MGAGTGGGVRCAQADASMTSPSINIVFAIGRNPSTAAPKRETETRPGVAVDARLQCSAVHCNQQFKGSRQ